ncbi:MAG: HAD family hydrolase [Siphonobacter sp.]
MNKCVFLDRDGVLNQDTEGYLFRSEDLIIPDGTYEALRRMKDAGYLLIVITNQAGIAKGLYKAEDVIDCYRFLQQQCGNILDDLYFSPHHPDYTSNSLLRKPESLMIEKAIAKYRIDPGQSWMVGDGERDVQAGHKAGVRAIRITHKSSIDTAAEAISKNLLEASNLIVS